MFTLGAVAAAMVLVTPSAAAATTTTTVSATGTPATTCPVTLTAKVAPTPSGGTVEFKEGTALLGGAAAPVTNGTATVNHTFTTTGAHIVVAKFSGSSGFDTSTSTNLTVNVTMGLNLGSICLPLG
ncbi:Ig-like domain-containing protein [Rhodococcus sp. NCIMB 12038]|uniref:Ig-like domain-containing protein n=1 Tax=Rhodococcus sp. NCIMB 12038 TaxID=933800 RepID=UPI000B3CD118|nr:Ig-like domain-containing protein [Rhodococcus sp. NCIMB 12038]OUS96010.1 hypothetical protein CA951_08815 [Rhodococcus sp. NCIMB 12038]